MFQDNINDIVNYAGLTENADLDIDVFIKDMDVVSLDKPLFPGSSVNERDREIWKAQCSYYVKVHGNCKKSMHGMYNIIWECCTAVIQSKVKKQPGFHTLSTDDKGWGHTKDPIALLKAVQALAHMFDVRNGRYMLLL